MTERTTGDSSPVMKANAQAAADDNKHQPRLQPSLLAPQRGTESVKQGIEEAYVQTRKRKHVGGTGRYEVWLISSLSSCRSPMVRAESTASSSPRKPRLR